MEAVRVMEAVRAMEAARAMEAVRAMAKGRTAVEGARVMPHGVRDPEHVLVSAGALRLLAMMGLAHAWRSVVLHLDARGVVEGSWAAAADLEAVSSGPQPQWPSAADEIVDGVILCWSCKPPSSYFIKASLLEFFLSDLYLISLFRPSTVIWVS